MNEAQRRRAEQLFHEAASLPAADQAAFLESNCDDSEVRAEVARLLRCDHAAAGGELTAQAEPPRRNGDPGAGVTPPGRGDLSHAVRQPKSSGASFDHGRFEPGSVISGRYRVVGLLGRGGMGEVYRADDLELGQSVALKFLPERLSIDQSGLERFRNEVRLARQVSHPNVCRVYDIGQADGQWYLSMEYVDGEDLSLLLRRIGRFSKDRAVEVARQLCLGLEAAHEKGVLHRDLKPANVMIDGRGKVLITDFGLAALAESVDGDDVRSGTPQYMAPEQLAGRDVTRQSDVYSLGLVLHEVFTGKPVWEAENLAELFKKRESSSARTPSSHIEDLDPVVERAIERCLEVDPRNRPTSALAVAAALPGGDPLSAVLAAGETPSPELVAAAGGERALRPAVAGALLIAIVVGIVGSLAIRTREELAHALPRPPEFLARDAQEMLESLGLRDAENPPRGMAYGFRLDSGTAGELEFWYRQSPELLHPTRRATLRVTLEDPPQDVPGMVTLRLDTEGSLLSLETVPSKSTGHASVEESSPDEPDWSAILGVVGEEPSDLDVVDDPGWDPEVFAEFTRTWERRGPRGERTSVRAAMLEGKPVEVQVEAVPGEGAEASRVAAEYDPVAYRTYTSLLLLVILCFAAPLARLNLLKGRCDRKGAARLAIFTFAATLLAWTLGSTHVPSLASELELFLHGLSLAAWHGVRIWVFYLALEPYVRRLWPESLITWSRLLRGRPRDARIGRDLLVGGAFFCFWFAINLFKVGLESWFELPRDPRPGLAVATLTGGRFLAEAMILIVLRAIGDSVFFLLVLLLLRVLVRRGWIAIVLFALLWSIMWCVARQPTSWLIAVPVFTSIGYVLSRYGLLASIGALIYAYPFLLLPLNPDPGSWFWDVTLYTTIALVALAAYSFWISLGRQPVRA